MDVVLEIFDTFALDRIYANVLPIHPSVSSFDPVSTLTASLKGYDAFNTTGFGSLEGAQGEFARSGWQYEPATQYLPIQPSEYAYMSRWDRDNIWRQAVSLYCITW